jgi:uncharacterized protein YcnI
MMRKRFRDIGCALASLIGVLALAVPASAGAHVRLLPAEAPAGGFTELEVSVPNESRDQATTKVEVRFPPGFTYVLYQPVAGWSVDVKMAKLVKPITVYGQTITEGVGRVTWTAQSDRAGIQPEQLQDFPIGLQVPGQPGDTLTFKALQEYEGGQVVRWIGAPTSRTPAPQIVVTDANEQSAAAGGQSAEGDSDSGSDGLAIAALVVAILALLAGGAALILSLRRTGG